MPRGGKLLSANETAHFAQASKMTRDQIIAAWVEHLREAEKVHFLSKRSSPSDWHARPVRLK